MFTCSASVYRYSATYEVSSSASLPCPWLSPAAWRRLGSSRARHPVTLQAVLKAKVWSPCLCQNRRSALCGGGNGPSRVFSSLVMAQLQHCNGRKRILRFQHAADNSRSSSQSQASIKHGQQKSEAAPAAAKASDCKSHAPTLRACA